jgi:hypothetical protein
LLHFSLLKLFDDVLWRKEVEIVNGTPMDEDGLMF